MAFTSGLAALASRSQGIDAIATDPSARGLFVRGCHQGYDKAHQRIGALVVDFGADIARVQSQLASRAGIAPTSVDALRLQVQVLRNRQVALRRIVDAMLSTKVGQGQHSRGFRQRSRTPRAHERSARRQPGP
jgi:hypothetical protein